MSAQAWLDLSLQHQVSGKTVIITGGANGIGAATATLYNRHNANVVIADLPASRASAEVLIKTFAHPERSIFLPVDILDWTQMNGIFKQVIKLFGCIDVVVANAGIMESSPVLDLEGVDSNGDLLESREAFRVLDVNIKGTFNSKTKRQYGPTVCVGEAKLTDIPSALRLAMHHMRASGGTVVLVASTSGYFGGTGVAAYVSSKHAIIGLLRSSQATATKNNIRVNAVAPFFTPTHITSSYADKWQQAGLEGNTPDGVAAVILQASLEKKSGMCILVRVMTLPSSIYHAPPSPGRRLGLCAFLKGQANINVVSRHVEGF